MLVFTDGFNNCFFPMGQASDACGLVMNYPEFNNSLNNFQSANQNCNLAFENDNEQMVHIESTCTCTSLVNATAGNITVAGYVFNDALGLPLTPDFPTSSPYVTSVGATQFYGGNSPPTAETPCSILTKALITSGGGFAWHQGRPSFQEAQVQAWIQSSVPKPPQAYFNINMRGYPDIVFNGHNYQIYYGNGTAGACPCLETPVDGTSASSPSLAGLISLINDQLLQQNLDPVGPLAPHLYQAYAANPSIFNDIQTGDNKCNRAYCCEFGYTSGPGWDPVTGLGSPNFGELLNYIMQSRTAHRATYPKKA
jgi:subtilase family serine protease